MRLKLLRRLGLAKLKRAYLWLNGLVLSVLLTACSYQNDETATPTPTLTPPPAPAPKETDLGAANFLVKGIADILNSFAKILGEIGIGVLKWFISTSQSLNLTKGGDYRQCKLSGFDVANAVDPLASCSIAIYDQFKFLPAALLGLALTYFFLKYTFKGLGLFRENLSISDYFINIFVVAFVAFNVDFILTVIMDIAAQLFLLILTLGESGGGGGGSDLTTLFNRLDKLTALFDISKVHNNNLGVALVLVIVCIPAMLALLLMGIFFFLRILLFLLYFLLGTVAAAAKLTDETAHFFTSWWQGALKLAATSLPLAIVLRLALEVAGVLDTGSQEATPDVLRYIILVLFITVFFLAGGLYALAILQSEVRSGIATLKGVRDSAGRLAGRAMGSQSAASSSNSRRSQETSSLSSRSEVGSNRAEPQTSNNNNNSSNSNNAANSRNLNTPPLTPQVLTSAISTGMTMAYQSQQARQERSDGAMLNQLTSMRVSLEELKQRIKQQTEQASPGEARLAILLEQMLTELRQSRPSNANKAARGAAGAGGYYARPNNHSTSVSAYSASPMPTTPYSGNGETGGEAGESEGGRNSGWAGANPGPAYRSRPGAGAGAGAAASPPVRRRTSPAGTTSGYDWSKSASGIAANPGPGPGPTNYGYGNGYGYAAADGAVGESGSGSEIAASYSAASARPAQLRHPAHFGSGSGSGSGVGPSYPASAAAYARRRASAQPLVPSAVGAPGGSTNIGNGNGGGPNTSSTSTSSQPISQANQHPVNPSVGVVDTSSASPAITSPGAGAFAPIVPPFPAPTRPVWQPQTRSWQAGPAPFSGNGSGSGSGSGSTQAYGRSKGEGGSDDWQPNAAMIINPNTGLPYTARRIKPLKAGAVQPSSAA